MAGHALSGGHRPVGQEGATGGGDGFAAAGGKDGKGSADHLFGGPAEDVLGGLVPVQDGPFEVQGVDGDRRVVERELEGRAGALHLLGHVVHRGDVVVLDQGVDGLAVTVGDQRARDEGPHLAAVRPHDAVLGLIAGQLAPDSGFEGGFEVGSGRRLGLGVQGVGPDEILAGQAVEACGGLVHPDEVAGHVHRGDPEGSLLEDGREPVVLFGPASGVRRPGVDGVPELPVHPHLLGSSLAAEDAFRHRHRHRC